MGKTNTTTQETTTPLGEKPKGWHSRRHETREQQVAARAQHDAETQLREIGADRREHNRNKRTPAQQLMVLDERLGLNKGARKERARLRKLIGPAAG